jgi:hypothetical protein
MKHLIVLLLVLLSVDAFAQQNRQNPEKGRSIVRYTNYTATSDDTTDSYIAVPITSVLLGAKEVGVITIATDSVQATLNFIGRNELLTTVTDTYVDSISTLGQGVAPDATTPFVKVTMLKDAVVNRLEGCTQFKIGTVFLNAAHIGTTSGRTLTHYLFWVQQ